MSIKLPVKLSVATNTLSNINKCQEELIMSNRIVCDCVGTTVEDIKKAVENGAKTVEDIKDATEAGTICCGCDCELETTLHEVL